MQMLDRAPSVGHSWRRRWDSLRLFTPIRYGALPGSRMPGGEWSYPSKDEVADYLDDYAAREGLRIRTETEVTRLTGARGAFSAETDAGERWRADQVIVATGPFGKPFIPGWANDLPADIRQLHSDDYHSPRDVPDDPVLVVGGGNSGRQIALELASADRVVHMAHGRRSPQLPQRLLGRDLFWWLTTAGVMRVRGSSALGRTMRAKDPVIGSPMRALIGAGVSVHSRAVNTVDGRVRFHDGHAVEPKSVVWATGFRLDDRWVRIPGAVDASGALVSTEGRTPIPGLFTIGRSWQRTRGSALLGYVGSDAEQLVREMAIPRR